MDKPRVLFPVTEQVKASPAKEAPPPAVPRQAAAKPRPMFPAPPAAPVVPAFKVPAPAPTSSAPSQVKGPKPLFEVLPAAAPPVEGAPVVVALPGMFVRKRPDVTAGVLRTFNLDVTDEAVFQAALEEILHADPDRLTVESALEFGIVDQRAFAAVSEQMLKMSMNPVLVEIVENLHKIAADIRQTSAPGNSFHRFVESFVASEKESEISKINRVSRETELVNQKMGHLPLIRQEIAKLVKDLETCLFSVQQRLVVGRWFVAVIARKEISSVLDGRVQSLSVTRLSLLQARQQVKVIDDRVVHLITVVNASLVNMVPAWHGSCIAALENKNSPPSNMRAKILEVLDAVK